MPVKVIENAALCALKSDTGISETKLEVAQED